MKTILAAILAFSLTSCFTIRPTEDGKLETVIILNADDLTYTK